MPLHLVFFFSDAQRVLETNHVIHGCPVQLALHGESEINDDCVSDQSDFVVFRGKERLDSSFDANVLPPYEAAIQGMAEPRGIFMTCPYTYQLLNVVIASSVIDMGMFPQQIIG